MLKLTPIANREYFDFQTFDAFQKLLNEIKPQDEFDAQGNATGKKIVRDVMGADNFNQIREALHLDFIEKETQKSMSRLNKDPNAPEKGVAYVQHRERLQELKNLHNDMCFFILILLQRIMWRRGPRDDRGRQMNSDDLDYTFVPMSSAIAMVRDAAKDIMKLHQKILEIKFSGKAAMDIIDYEDNLGALAEKAEFGQLLKVQPAAQIKEVQQAVKKGGRKKKVVI